MTKTIERFDNEFDPAKLNVRCLRTSMDRGNRTFDVRLLDNRQAGGLTATYDPGYHVLWMTRFVAGTSHTDVDAYNMLLRAVGKAEDEMRKGFISPIEGEAHFSLAKALCDSGDVPQADVYRLDGNSGELTTAHGFEAGDLQWMIAPNTEFVAQDVLNQYRASTNGSFGKAFVEISPQFTLPLQQTT